MKDCSVCKRENVMRNIPEIRSEPVVIMIRERVIIEDNWFKYVGRLLFWNFVFLGTSCTISFLVSVFFSLTVVVTVEAGCISSIVSMGIVFKNRKWLISNVMPACLHYDDILYA